MTLRGLSFALLPIAALHVAEESRFGWLAWARRYVADLSRAQFVIVNALFLCLCALASVWGSPLLPLSVWALLLVNALVHLVPSVARREYSPGLVTALLLYAPGGAWAFALARRDRAASATQLLLAAALGVAWMAIPPLLHVARRGVRAR